MCGRYTLMADPRTLAEHFDVEFPAEARYNIALAGPGRAAGAGGIIPRADDGDGGRAVGRQPRASGGQVRRACVKPAPEWSGVSAGNRATTDAVIVRRD